MFRLLVVLFPLWLWLSPCALGQPVQQVRYLYLEGRGPYEVQLLQLLLDETANEYGKAQVLAITKNSLGTRGEIALIQQLVDVASFTPDPKREETLMMVTTPIMQGMLGYRLLLTNAESEKKIAASPSRDDFRQKMLGVVVLHWGDFKIFSHNQFLVATVLQHQTLWQKLASGKVDYFATGLNEVVSYLKQYQAQIPELRISSDVALFYPFDFFFHVSRSNPQLAERLTKGFAKAEQAGSFKRLFTSYFSENIEKLKQINPKHVYYLDNPDYNFDKPIQYEWWSHKELPFMAATSMDDVQP